MFVGFGLLYSDQRHQVGYKMWAFGLLFWVFQATGVQSNVEESFRSLFVRHSNNRLSAQTAKFINNATVDSCTDYCIREVEFQCKSFDFDNTQKACLLFSVNVDDRDVHLIDSVGKDHFETAYTRLFNRLPTHRLPVITNRPVPGVSQEGCARHCIMETYFKCRGFNYRAGDERCMLVDNTPATSTGALYSQDVDYFERKPEGTLSKFVNFGMGRMRPLASGLVHQKGRRGLTLDECANLCLEETTFDCMSFDYVFEGAESDCYLSQYIAANVGGLVIDVSNVQHNHFEKIEKYLTYFYATPYAVIPGNNLKTYERVTPDRCARYCIDEDSFVCRSFDYRIGDAFCMLSDKAGSDVGGLTTNGGFEGDVHHFEMKPILDCGGNFTEEEGNIASPNWPRDYSHHELCEWHISTSQFKVIRLTFTHFDMGLQSSDPCNPQDDRLVLTYLNQNPHCVLPNAKTINTKSSQVSLAFHTNGHVDAQGFRMFYTADWTCNENLNVPGEIASPTWPKSYPSGSRCSWKLTAPLNHRVQLRVTSFELEQHSLGHCNEQYDHLKVLDGGTVNSPLVGLYCGRLSSFVVRSSGLDMFIQFYSDNDLESTRQGFHASFSFESRNDTYFDRATFAGPGYTSGIRENKSAHGESSAVSGRVSASGPETREGWVSLADHHQYKTTMWAVVTLLLLLLVSAGIGLFLLYRYHRGRINREQELVEQDGVIIPLTALPNTAKQNNAWEPTPCAAQVFAPVPDTELGATAAVPSTEECKLNNLQLGKYAKENEKNINVHQKNLDHAYL